MTAQTETHARGGGLALITVPTPAGNLTVALDPGTGVLRGTSFWGAEDVLRRLRKVGVIGAGSLPAAEETAAVARVRDAFARYADGQVDALDELAVEQPGGSFTQRAWTQMRKVHGVATYGEIAAAAGSPTAYRAAGAACANNIVPLVVPCHRILTADRRIGGYYFGGAIKEMLLSHEGAMGGVRGTDA